MGPGDLRGGFIRSRSPDLYLKGQKEIFTIAVIMSGLSFFVRAGPDPKIQRSKDPKIQSKDQAQLLQDACIVLYTYLLVT